jgi:outer membrane lipoprotein SlyB
VIGVLGGIALGAYVDATHLWTSSAGQETGTFIGITAAGAVGGYFAGRAIDKRVTHIKIVP